MILAGDVGGTKCNIALYEISGRDFSKVAEQRFESRQFESFDAVIASFLGQHSINTGSGAKIEAAGFGVAGPVINNQVKTTNLPWTVNGAAVGRQLSTPHVVLMNDLEATAHSVALLKPAEISVLNQGAASGNATQAMVAAGTGLGEAILFWDGQRTVVGSSEGGHTDFSPRNEQEIALLRHMKQKHEFVSWELILSGRGFRTIHEFLDPSVRHATFSGAESEAAPEITRLGLAGECATCVQTLELWVSLYGAEAGNLALKVLCRGGMWVAGGIAVKIRPKMEDGTFVKAFCAKEQFGSLLMQFPIRMVLNEDAPLLGAMSQAALVLSS